MSPFARLTSEYFGWLLLTELSAGVRSVSLTVTAARHDRTVEFRQEQQARHLSTLQAGLGSELTSIGFARLARALSTVAATFGISQLSFRSPGRVGVGRAIRRNADGSATVAVRYRGRPALSVAADMIEGVVQAGGTSAVSAESRDALWMAAGSVLASEIDGSGTGIRHNAPAQQSPGTAAPLSQSSAARHAAVDSGSGPSDQATRRAA